MTLGRNSSAWIFAEPVNAEAFNLVDYHTIVKNPMDFSTIKNKLKSNQYANISEFMDDMELVFYNCRLYNGEQAGVGQMGKTVHEEYKRLKDQLFLNFYV